MVEHADRNNLLKRAMAEYQSREASGARWDETEFFRRFASIEEELRAYVESEQESEYYADTGNTEPGDTESTWTALLSNALPNLKLELPPVRSGGMGVV